MKIQRGHLYLANLNAGFGTEVGKVRPVLVMQSNLVNKYHRSSMILPLTTKIADHPTTLRVALKLGDSGLKQNSDILIDQMKAIDNRRFVREIGVLSSTKMKETEKKFKILLDLE